jgi:hypothetical protein
METNNYANEVLLEKMQADVSCLEPPSLDKLKQARLLVEARKKSNNQREDIFWLMASFLNLKIKLYHAICVAIGISIAVFYFSNAKTTSNIVQEQKLEETNLVSINSSTVLSSIKTFINKQN